MSGSPKIPWPPKVLHSQLQSMAYWQAWYAGDRNSLETAGAAKSDKGGILRNLFVRTWQYFWGQTVANDGSEPEIKVHVPLAKDIAKAKRAMLFAQPPSLLSTPIGEDSEPDDQGELPPTPIADATVARLNQYEADGIMQVFAGGAEICGALGGIYLRMVIDYTNRKPSLTRVSPRKAYPLFADGRLVQVTFWTELPSNDNTTWRWLEKHFTDDGTVTGIGCIEHTLWQGTNDDLGEQQAIDVSVFPQMADVVKAMNSSVAVLGVDEVPTGVITTETPGLAVVYIPNATPNALWMDDPIGQHLGLPDIQGSEDLLDRLDFLMSSLLEEFDLSKARITVPDYMLNSNGPGKGASWDRNKRIWQAFNMAPTDATAGNALQLFQPDIRVDAHIAGMQELTEVIVRSAGFSASTFGEDEEGGAQTATEVVSRDRRSRITRGDAISIWIPLMEEILFKMLSTDVLYGWAEGPVDPSSLTVVFPKETSMTPQEAALYVQVMRAAQAMSIEEAVRSGHPDWEEPAILEEVEKIKAEQMVQSPDTFTGGGNEGNPAEISGDPNVSGDVTGPPNPVNGA
jgi:hypothetical protein